MNRLKFSPRLFLDSLVRGLESCRTTTLFWYERIRPGKLREMQNKATYGRAVILSFRLVPSSMGISAASSKLAYTTSFYAGLDQTCDG